MLAGMSWQERLAFLAQFRREFATTGAVQPSSRFLAREMTAPLREDRRRHPERAVHVVEMGPGTGAVTQAIASALGPADRLDCWEINPDFAEFLRQRVDADPEFAASRGRITVHCAPAQEADIDDRADFVICSVPLNNLPATVVEAIFDRGFALLDPGDWFTFFEYPVLPRLKYRLAAEEERHRIDAVTAIKRRFRSRGSRSRVVPINVPPARAVHIRVS